MHHIIEQYTLNNNIKHTMYSNKKYYANTCPKTQFEVELEKD